MHSFYFGRVNENLDMGARRRQLVDLLAVQLAGKIGLEAPLRILLEEAGAQRAVDHVLNPADDAVVVETFYAAERGLDLAADSGRAARAIAFGSGIVAGIKQFSQKLRDIGI